MPPSLGSMTSQCLQQRDGYPYMFTDPLHSLSSPYNSHPRSSSCNPTAAHQQSHYSPSNSGSSGISNYLTKNSNKFNNEDIQINLGLTGVPGVSVPIQIPAQGSENYWPRLQWSSFFGLPTLGWCAFSLNIKVLSSSYH